MMSAASLDQSNHIFCTDLIGRINMRWSLRIDAIIFNETLPVHERKHRTIAAVVEAALEEMDRHREDMGLEPDGVDNQALLDTLRRGSVDEEPNIAVSRHNFKIIRKYRGEEITRYIRRLASRLEQISQSQSQSPGVLATEFVAGELVAVGVAMGFAVRKLMVNGEVLKDAIKLAITKIGPKAIVVAVIVALIGILFYLTISNVKRILGVVFNDTDSDLVVTDWQKGTEGGDRPSSGLYMEHGAVKSFPLDTMTDELDSPKVQVHARSVTEKGNDNEVMVYAGIFTCEKVIGFRGTEGLFRFSGLPDNQVFSVMFAVPYSKDNGTNVAISKSQFLKSKPVEFRDLYQYRQVDVDKWINFHMTSSVNSARGGIVSLIASISDN